ncbi:uncharacterized protein LOC128677125 [Plodia interpunctella]|uniref:uncharacterized protein LOC128677125 n=1 Tax=Plodia interpunctella TaxID=58824 RepID=UPI0023678E12|nr:uncharacterized protein LOC128677125 [Plodia interpunctella]
MFIMKRILLLSVFIVTSQAKNKTELFGFPETEEDENLKNKENRQPVFLPTVCPDTELYYPGDQKDDWICDCRPAFIYHPATDKCWPAFQKGPCKEKEYLILPQNSVIPVCVQNPCVVDGFVEWNQHCQRLGSTKACEDLFPIPAALGVNATTLVVSCVRLNVELRFASVVPVSPVASCPRGCKRNVNAQCMANS